MKKILLLMTVSFAVLYSFGQSDRYSGAMKKNLAEIDSSLIKGNADGLASVAANFERIGDAEKSLWLPYYYSAYCHVMCAFVKNDPISNDGFADKADQALAKAEALEKNNSEISLLKAMITSSRMLVNPMQRWMELGPKIQQYSQESMTQDPTNPRPHWFNGVSLKNTPEQFGGGCGTAKPALQKAMELFGNFKPASELHPNWGRQVCERDLSDCK
jgi:hypothetical protein